MAITEDNARELIESVFTFDYVGDAMMAVRRNITSDDAQRNLVEELARSAAEQSGETSAESLSAIGKAAEVRVREFVAASKRATTGCGGTPKEA
jgi:putative heme degradation protein